MQVSVIIPVFNCEKHIIQCLNSVCEQTLQDIEVICVDDGSTDQSYSVMKAYSRSDFRVKVIKQRNEGAGSARNLGLQQAKGKYVIFLDADDFYYEKDALEKMFFACEQNKVKVCGSCLKLLRGGCVADDVTLREIKAAAAKTTILEYKNFQFDYGYTGFLFQREMLLGHNIQFPLYRRFQDPPFLVRAMYAADKFVFCDAALYCYRVPVMATRFDREKVIDLLKGLKDNLLFAHKHGLKQLFRATLMRVEYEYYSILCRWIDKTDFTAVELLEEIQSIAGSELQQDKYVLRALQFVNENDNNFFENYEQDFIAKIVKIPEFFLYGAGGLAKKFLKFLKCNELLHKVKNIIVSKGTEEKEYVEGIELKAITELTGGENTPVYIATGAIFHHEIVKELQDRNINNYCIIDSVFLEELEV